MALKGEEVVITKDGVAVVTLVPTIQRKHRPPPGLFNGLVEFSSDAFDPLTDEEMEDLFGH